jgi:multiple sugar transport system permease protein
MTTLIKSRGTANAVAAPRVRRRRHRGEPAALLTMLGPMLVFLLVLRLVPAGIAVADSLRRHTLLGGDQFAGLRNYATIFTDPTFRHAVLTTLVFSLVINPLQVAVSLALATLYTRGFPGTGLWRTLVVLPIAVPPAVSATFWGIIYRPDGLGNALLHSVGLGSQGFLTDSHQALASIIVLLSWVGVGYWMLFLIAGINDIPPSLYEAAEIDGAPAWRRFVHVTLPMLRRPLAFVLVADTVSNFLVFAPVQQLTNGGPDQSTNLIMFDIYTRAYTYGDQAAAQAEVVLLVLLVLVVVAIQFRLLRAKD